MKRLTWTFADDDWSFDWRIVWVSGQYKAECKKLGRVVYGERKEQLQRLIVDEIDDWLEGRGLHPQ
jgi:hypothetical protein